MKVPAECSATEALADYRAAISETSSASRSTALPAADRPLHLDAILSERWME
jgi:hypothetical protein